MSKTKEIPILKREPVLDILTAGQHNGRLVRMEEWPCEKSKLVFKMEDQRLLFTTVNTERAEQLLFNATYRLTVAIEPDGMFENVVRNKLVEIGERVGIMMKGTGRG